MNVYAPNKARKKIWTHIKNKSQDIDCVINGDFNMTKARRDSSGPSPLIKGNKKLEWRLLANYFGMIDSLTLLGKGKGSHFTKRRNHGGHLDQSRIDKMYLSSQGWWPYPIASLKHIQM